MGTYGIDLGTTYSCIAKLDANGNPEVIQNFNDGTSTLASAVFFEEESSNAIIGENAKEYMETSPERLVQFAKREIGKDNGKNWVIDGTTYSPIEISALILKKLKTMAEEQGNEPVDNVIITCPAYFGLSERNATAKAGELAGMNVINLVNEPTAAAISYCFRAFQDNETVLVYDLGGGTFDVTVLQMKTLKDANGNDIHDMTVLSTTGNDLLGGKDWDEILFQIMCEKFCNESGMDPAELASDSDTRQAIRGKVEKTKKNLTETEAAKAKIKSDAGPVSITVTREEFEAATSHLVAQTMDLTEKAIQMAGGVTLDKVLLVGGSTYMPMIRNTVMNRFPGIVQVENPDKAVAMGAAIYASILVNDSGVQSGEANSAPAGPGNITDNPPPVVTHDITPRSFGPGIFSNDVYVVDNIIKINTPMPATVTKTYSTMATGQRRVNLAVFEDMSNEDRVKPCEDEDGNPQETNSEYFMKKLGSVDLLLPPNLPEGTPIEVTFTVEGSGLHVVAKNVTTGEFAETLLTFESKQTSDASKVTGISVND